MGFLKKIVKKVKKGVKKIGKSIKKTFKKFNLKKALKIAAIAAAVVVTGGAAVSAFTGGTATGFGGWLMNAGNAITNFSVGGLPIGQVLKPAEWLGTGLGKGARALTDFTGITDAQNYGQVQSPDQAKEILKRSGMTPETMGKLSDEAATNLAQSYVDTQSGVGRLTQASISQASGMPLPPAETTEATGFFSTPTGQVVGEVGKNVFTSAATGYIRSELQGEPEPYGSVGYGLGEERGIDLNPLQVAYSQAGVDINSAYENLTFGTGDIGYLNANLYRQQTLAGGLV